MKLLDIELDHYAQHTHLAHSFSGNLIGIIGRNGRGKSNFLGSCEFLFTGNQTDKTKSELLQWGAEEGSVKGHFVHNGIQGTISRSLHNTNASYAYGDTNVKGTKKIEEAMRDTLGSDRDLLKQGVFVAQRELDAVLFEDPAVREQAFLRMIGLGFAARTHASLGKYINTLPATQEFSDTIKTLEAQLATAQEQLNTVNAQLQQMQASTSQVADTAVINARITELNAQRAEINSALQTYRTVSARRAQLEQSILDQQTKLAQLRDPTPSSVDELRNMIDQSKQLLTQINAYASVKGSVDALQAKLNSLVLAQAPTLQQLPYTADQLKTLQDAVNTAAAAQGTASSNQRLYKGLLDVLKTVAAGAECPVCGNQIQDAKRLENGYTKATQEYNAASTSLRTVGDQLNAATRQCRDIEQANKVQETTYVTAQALYTANKNNLEAQLAQLTAQLAQLRDPGVDANALSAGINNAQQLLTQKQAFEAANAQAISQLAATKSTHELALVDEQNAMARLGGSVETGHKTAEALDGQINQMTLAVQAVNELKTQMAALQAAYGTQAGYIQVIEKQLADFKAKQTTELQRRQLTGILTNVQGWFHYSQGPRKVMAAVLQELTQDVNTYLEYFSAPFRVLPSTTGMGFNVQFVDGRTMPEEGQVDAKVLSGGERVLLAVSFRFAGYAMFAQKFGMLILDEPTVYLDKETIGRFPVVLMKIKELSQKLDLQIIISTHEESLIPYMDSVIKIG